MMDLLRNNLVGETFEPHIARALDIDGAEKGLLKGLLALSLISASIATL